MIRDEFNGLLEHISIELPDEKSWTIWHLLKLRSGTFMKLNKQLSFFVPDQKPIDEAIKRTHMAIAAHQDDIEIMAYDGILKCFGRMINGFSVVATNGSGSQRGLFKNYTDSQMIKITNKRKLLLLVNLALLLYSIIQVKK